MGFTHQLFKELILVPRSHETMVAIRKILKSDDISDLLGTNLINYLYMIFKSID